MHLVPALEFCGRLIRRFPWEFDSTPAPPTPAGRHALYRTPVCTTARGPAGSRSFSGRPRRQ